MGNTEYQIPHADYQADLCADVLGTVGVGERVARLLEVEASRTDVCNHHRLTVAAQCVLEQPRQLAVTVVDVLTARLVTCINSAEMGN